MKRRAAILSIMLAAGVCATPAYTANAAPHIHPYNGVEAETNFGSSGVEVITEADGRKVVSSIEKDDYFTVKTCDFSSGLASITITAKCDGMGVIDVRKGDSTGESLGNIKLKNTNGEYQTFTATLKDLVGDNETITFVGAVGNVSIDNWIATPSITDPGQPDQPDPGQPDPGQPDQPTTPVDIYAGVEAENVESSNATVNTADGVTYQTINAGGYVVVKGVDFTNGISGVFANAQASKPKTSIAIYVDSLDGAPIATITVTSRSFKDVATKINNDLSGTHDIYLVAVGNPVDLNSFKVMANPNHTPDQPDPGQPDQPDPGQPDQPDPGQPDQPTTPVDIYAGVEAENVEANSATVNTADGVTYQTINAGGYVVVKGVDFTNGISGVFANAQASKPKTSIAVYIDSLDSAPIATITVTSRSFKDVAAKISSDLSGTHDIYLVAVGNPVDLDSFKVMANPNHTPDQPDPGQPDQPDPGQPDQPDPCQPDQPDPGQPDQPDPGQPDQPIVEGKDVSYTINSWGTGYLVNFKVTNNTGAAVSGWTVKVRKDQVNIDSSWCVNIKEEGDYYVITPLEWNTNLAPGQSVEFGIIGTGSIGTSIEVTVQ
ncbi:Cornifin (SPRR) family protein [Butyrivibrio fibrisolvens DSM 3071]|uniref:Cornifin (SPRR) family protein n=1 Tax=Butyrivibrio fibrisolvens DSM 3071 TaxID=1121131 RepID=A0A1M6D9B6_BUTFI|nr:carbohydrate-binding protein [Butyrivibrio fibrisolvens]SHI69730.1 Cornifin (SPRR) family protein [Butyrivibrio fibrisolvens DSM 3071]